MLYETVVIQEPLFIFAMPKMKKVLEDVVNGKSEYIHWGKGSVQSEKKAYLFYCIIYEKLSTLEK